MRDGRLVIGGAAGFWGEAPHATRQLLRDPDLDVLVYDFLAEVTMSILARARARDPEAGWAKDFVPDALAPNLTEIARRGVTVLTNAGGVNPAACAAACRDACAKAGVALKIAVVEGDDLLPRAAGFAAVREMFTGAPFPPAEAVASVNAYLGAGPVIRALEAGADIVITGRVADSALALAACAHRFGWGPEAFDRLSAGALCGHLLECGPQATGGNFTDWEGVGDLAEIGYPIAEVAADGAVVITKPEGTSGRVTPATVGEQMLYEIGDPAAYLLADVACDWTGVRMAQEAPDRVSVRGARGAPPTGDLKVCATWFDGFRAGHVLQFNGRAAEAKARAYAEAMLARARARLRAINAPDYSETLVETFGGPAGPNGYAEVTLKTAVKHADARAVGLFLKETIGGALGTPPGLAMFTGAGRPKPSPVVRLFSFTTPAEGVPVTVTLDGAPVHGPAPMPPPATEEAPASTPLRAPAPPAADGPMAEVPLEALARARSGDKGDSANIGVIARDPAFLPWIDAALSDARIRSALPGPAGRIEVFALPGTHARNILIREALGGGGVASLRDDPQAKGFAQRLLALPVALPASLAPATMPWEAA